jgi:prepilin-type processing-associated H-X9-DG protein
LIPDANYGELFKDPSIALNTSRNAGQNYTGLATNSWDGKSARVVRIRKPGRMISFIDGMSAMWAPGGWNNYPWPSWKDPLPWVNQYDVTIAGSVYNWADRHNGSVNMAFVDGHAGSHRGQFNPDADHSKYISSDNKKYIAGQVDLLR